MGLLSRIFGCGHGQLPEAINRHKTARKRLDTSVPLSDADLVVFDTELTGLDFKRDSVVSIGAIRMRGGMIYPAKAFHSLVKPRSHLKSESVVVHEITHSDLDEAATDCEVIERFVEFVGDAVLVGHFVGIDVNFVSKAMKSCFGVPLSSRTVDTMAVHEWLIHHDSRMSRHFRGLTRNKDLASMAKHYGVSALNAHNAFHDAYVTAQLLQRFMHFLPDCGVRTLGDLLRVGNIKASEQQGV